jgi:sugar (pentulose or hexulose) kinase
VTGLPSVGRRSGQAASAGAALLAARAVGGAGAAGPAGDDLEHLDPVAHRTEPDPEDVRAYRILRARSDRLVTTMLGLPGPSGPEGGPEAEAVECG